MVAYSCDIKRTARGDSYKFERFDSKGEIVDFLKKYDPLPSTCWVDVTSENDRKIDNNTSFYGTTREEALELLGGKVVDEDVRTVRNETNRLMLESFKVDDSTRELRVAGVAPCVPAALSGRSKCMYRPASSDEEVKVVNLFVQCTVSAYVTTERIRNVAKGVALAVMKLEQKNYRVNLYYVSASDPNRGTNQVMVLKLKRANEPLNWSKLYFPLIRADAFFRTVMFTVYGRTMSTNACSMSAWETLDVLAAEKAMKKGDMFLNYPDWVGKDPMDVAKELLEQARTGGYKPENP